MKLQAPTKFQNQGSNAIRHARINGPKGSTALVEHLDKLASSTIDHIEFWKHKAKVLEETNLFMAPRRY